MYEKQLSKAVRLGLQPGTALWNLYRPENAEFAFRSKTLAEARAWQKRTAAALAETIGFQDLPKFPLSPKKIESVDKGDYIREKIIIRTAPDMTMPVYLLLPKKGGHGDPPLQSKGGHGDPPLQSKGGRFARRLAQPAPTSKTAPMPVVIAFHGHGYGVKDIVGLWEDGAERNTPDGYHKDFAVALCRRGFAVAAPEISCFGERQTDFSYLNTRIGQVAPTTCTHSAMLAFTLGKSVAGLRVHDAKVLVDYLATRKELDAARLGAMGISGGGMHTFFSTCLDPRIRACVVSGYYSTFRDSILGMAHCACNFVPGLHRFGEMYDLVGLIAPRPMLVEAANYDPIFPIRAVRQSVKRAREVYRVFGAEGEVETDFFEGRHQISGKRAYDFLWEKVAAAVGG